MNITLSADLIITLVVNLVAIGIFIGIFKTTISFMEQQILELKDDMRRYNNILERMIKVEESTKSAHHRLDEAVEKGVIKNG